MPLNLPNKRFLALTVKTKFPIDFDKSRALYCLGYYQCLADFESMLKQLKRENWDREIAQFKKILIDGDRNETNN